MIADNNYTMEGETQGEQISKTSPLRKAGYAAVVVTATGITLPFLFGINTFSWVTTWIIENWPRVIILAGFVAYLAKSRLG